MILAIDSGNTNIVFAVFDDGGNIKGEWRASTHATRTADEFGVWLDQVMGLKEVARKEITGVIIANVVPGLNHALATLSRRYFDCEPLVVGTDNVALGIDVRVDHPNEVGADRLVNAISAFESNGGPLVIVDFGTATTFDVVDADGNYCGGAIAPGIHLSLDALQAAAAKLPPVAITRPQNVIGKATVPAMQSGIYWGYVGLIDGLVARIKLEAGFDSMRVIATGGLAELFVGACDSIDAADRDLTLRGLFALYQRNKA